MNILFIYRDKHYYNHNFSKIFKKNLCKIDFGFLLLSLKTIANIELMSVDNVIKLKKKIDCDYVFIDSKIKIDYKEDGYLSKLKKIIPSKIFVFLSYDRAIHFEDIYPFEKYFDVKSYFIPNLYKNLDNYKVPALIKNKFYATHYGLGFTEIQYDFSKKNFLIEHLTNKDKYDLFYSGEKTKGKIIRTKIIEDIINDKNIINKKIIYYESKDRNKFFLSPEKYMEYTQQAKINLVLAGNVNNITYRLYEVLFLRSFFLIDPHFTNYRISDNFDNISDFTFFDLKDLTTKIKYYLNNYNYAEQIIRKHTKIFEKIYNPHNHGEYLKKIIQY